MSYLDETPFRSIGCMSRCCRGSILDSINCISVPYFKQLPSSDNSMPLAASQSEMGFKVLHLECVGGRFLLGRIITRNDE
jgi:hypothetical protein